VALLAKERTLAVTSVRLLKKYGDTVAIDRGSLSYGEAKAEYDGIIAGLIVTLACKEDPISLSYLQMRLVRGFDKREAFCKDVRTLLPTVTGEKGVMDSIVVAAIGPLLQALQSIYSRATDENDLTRTTIQTQLEAATWPEYTSIAAT
jgi:hypothetical protein